MGKHENLKVILFDLGGVLLELNDPIEIFGLDISESEFKERWIRSPTVRKFESGGMDKQEFARKIVGEADFPFGWREFIDRFDSWPGRLFNDTIALLEAIPPQYSRAVLSNINASHWSREDISGQLSPHIDRAFLSFETGLVKPDPDAFIRVAKTYQCRPGEVLFFDDTESSVAAAIDVGMQAVHAVGIDAVRRVLSERGVLD